MLSVEIPNSAVHRHLHAGEPGGPFAGENADGTWLLNVSDNAVSDTGSVPPSRSICGGGDCTNGD